MQAMVHVFEQRTGPEKLQVQSFQLGYSPFAAPSPQPLIGRREAENRTATH
jgi:hypothetical protein